MPTHLLLPHLFHSPSSFSSPPPTPLALPSVHVVRTHSRSSSTQGYYYIYSRAPGRICYSSHFFFAFLIWGGESPTSGTSPPLPSFPLLHRQTTIEEEENLLSCCCVCIAGYSIIQSSLLRRSLTTNGEQVPSFSYFSTFFSLSASLRRIIIDMYSRLLKCATAAVNKYLYVHIPIHIECIMFSSSSSSSSSILIDNLLTSIST